MQAPESRTAYRLALGLALVALLLLVWLSLGVGIIGADGDPANLMYFAVFAIGVVGAVVARLHTLGMARTLFIMAITQGLITGIALVMGLGLPWSGPAELILLNGFFVAMFAVSGWLFIVQHESK